MKCVKSNEPGFYKDGAWGIRIESDLVTVPTDGLFGSATGGSGNRREFISLFLSLSLFSKSTSDARPAATSQ
jgi:Xaa-Pro aminopeptidase